jgi:hypothetical protein
VARDAAPASASHTIRHCEIFSPEIFSPEEAPMRHVALLGLAALAVAALPARHSAAQGLLHKHRHVAGPGLAAMRPLSAQASAVAVAATGDVSASDGAATASITTIASIAAATTNPSTPGAVGGAPGMPPLGIVPPAAPLGGLPIDAMPMPMPSIEGGPPVACIDYPCVPPGFDPGVDPGFVPGFVPGFDPGFDPGDTVSVGGWLVTLGPPDGMKPGGGLGSTPTSIHHPFRGPMMFNYARGDASAANATALQANAFGAATASAAPPGRNVAGGLPGRAVGVRPGTLDVPGRRQMAPIGNAAPGSTASAGGITRDSGAIRDSGVIQAAGIAPQHEGATRRAGTAGVPATGPASATAAAPPRWRDRLRVAWPTVK